MDLSLSLRMHIAKTITISSNGMKVELYNRTLSICFGLLNILGFFYFVGKQYYKIKPRKKT